MSQPKVHYFTEDHFVNGSKVWFNSACKLIASGAPTERSMHKGQKVTCLRCAAALNKKK